MSRSARASFVGVIGGFSVWALAFVAIYGVQATGCVRGWDEVQVVGLGALRLGLVALLAMTLVTLVAVRPLPGGGTKGSLTRGSFLGTMARICHLAAVVATVFCFAAVLILPLC